MLKQTVFVLFILALSPLANARQITLNSILTSDCATTVNTLDDINTMLGVNGIPVTFYGYCAGGGVGVNGLTYSNSVPLTVNINGGLPAAGRQQTSYIMTNDCPATVSVITSLNVQIQAAHLPFNISGVCQAGGLGPDGYEWPNSVSLYFESSPRELARQPSAHAAGRRHRR